MTAENGLKRVNASLTAGGWNKTVQLPVESVRNKDPIGAEKHRRQRLQEIRTDRRPKTTKDVRKSSQVPLTSTYYLCIVRVKYDIKIVDLNLPLLMRSKK